MIRIRLKEYTITIRKMTALENEQSSDEPIIHIYVVT